MEEDIRKGGGKEVKKSKLAQNKIFGAAAVLLGVFGFLVITKDCCKGLGVSNALGSYLS